LYDSPSKSRPRQLAAEGAPQTNDASSDANDAEAATAESNASTIGENHNGAPARASVARVPRGQNPPPMYPKPLPWSGLATAAPSTSRGKDLMSMSARSQSAPKKTEEEEQAGEPTMPNDRGGGKSPQTV
jgi:hypothetical protein